VQPGVSYRTPKLRSRFNLTVDSSPYGVVTERSFTPNCACGLFGVIHLKLLTEFVRNVQNCPAHCIILPRTKSGGTGLGLAISRSIIESFGGTILFVPDEKGACFEILLPAI
jgi:hypothetical protein